MNELGLVNDESYARRLFRELTQGSKHLSIRAARYKLMEKGISRELIDLIAEENPVDEYEQVKIILSKKYNNFADDEKLRKRAISALQRKGFDWETIKSAMTEFEEENYGC